jgi:hypothetical protein
VLNSRECDHAAVRVVQNHNVLRAEQLLGDNEGAEGVLCTAAGVSDHMGITLLQDIRYMLSYIIL